MKTRMQQVPCLPGRWIDFSDPDNICVREADGTFVAGPLYISERDAEKLRRKLEDKIRDMKNGKDT